MTEENIYTKDFGKPSEDFKLLGWMENNHSLTSPKPKISKSACI